MYGDGRLEIDMDLDSAAHVFFLFHSPEFGFLGILKFLLDNVKLCSVARQLGNDLGR